MSADRDALTARAGFRRDRAHSAHEPKRKSPIRRRPPPLGAEASEPGAGAPANLHASCVVIGECGILIRGTSAAGKSSLAAILVSQARERGEFAAWVADDRVRVSAHGGRLVASPHPVIAGRFEARGVGILEEPHESSTVLRLVVDLEASIARLPSCEELTATIAGIAVQRLALVAGRVGLYETSLVFRLARTFERVEST